MPRLRTVLAIAALLAAAACSSETPTEPTASELEQPSGQPAPPGQPGPPGEPAPPPDTDDPPSVPGAPTIATQPKSQTIAAGKQATLSVKASGSGSLKYQWYAGARGQTSDPVSGARSDRFTTSALRTTARYWVRVTNAAGSVDSDTATITVEEEDETPSATAPKITSQPKDRSVPSGQSATLNVSATGTAPLTYRWYRGESGDTSSPVAGATSASYTTSPLTSTTRYWVRVSNDAGVVDSDTATITVSAPPEGNSSFENALLTLVNEHRVDGATCGSTTYGPAAALSLNTKLRTAARLHSQDMARREYFAHTTPDGVTFDRRIRDAGYSGSPLGENIAAGQPSPDSVMDDWMESTGHCKNIMNPAFRAIGIGYVSDPSSPYRHYWTMDLGGT